MFSAPTELRVIVDGPHLLSFVDHNIVDRSMFLPFHPPTSMSELILRRPSHCSVLSRKQREQVQLATKPEACTEACSYPVRHNIIIASLISAYQLAQAWGDGSDLQVAVAPNFVRAL